MAPIASSAAPSPPPDNGARVFQSFDTAQQSQELQSQQLEEREEEEQRQMKMPSSDEPTDPAARDSFSSLYASILPSAVPVSELASDMSPLSTNDAPLNEFMESYKSRLQQQQQYQLPHVLSAPLLSQSQQPLSVVTEKAEPPMTAMTTGTSTAADSTVAPRAAKKAKSPSPKRAREADGTTSQSASSQHEGDSSDSSTTTTSATATCKKMFQCTFPGCGKEFQLKGNLKRHQNIHRGDKQFRCKFCGKDFLRKADMEVHHRVHTGEKPYKCKFEDCDKCFARRSDLLSHERTHEGTKPYACMYPGCKRHFARKFDLQKHQRMHDNHSSECQKRRKLSSPASETAVADPISDDCNCWASPSLDEAMKTNEAENQDAHQLTGSAAASVAVKSQLPIANVTNTPRGQLTCTQDHIHSPPACFAAFTSVDSLETFLLSPHETFEIQPSVSAATAAASASASDPAHASCCSDHVHPSIKQQLEALDLGREAAASKPPKQQQQLLAPAASSYSAVVAQPPALSVPALPTALRTRSISSTSTSSATSCPIDAELLEGYAKHTPSCGHLSIVHGNHRDYVVKNHLVCPDSVRSISGGEHHLAKPSARCLENEPHRPGCGHLPVRHRDHIDYVVEDNLFCQQAGLLGDSSAAADHIELLDDDFWDFYGAIGSLTTD